MPKNIFIFADGTGQIGGLRPDQKLSNVYKLYRAVRPGPTSPISYADQVAYYDPGLGAGEKEGVTGSKIRNVLEQAVGSGIEKNMIDCYAKIISFYETGDRIILIGFSRGSYTVRALANMMNLCGVPTKLADGSPMPKTGSKLKEVAKEAVISVYGHGTGKPRGEDPFFRQREEKGRRFRVKYGCEACDGSDNLRGNVEPDFVGVFDTVAALQNGRVVGLVRSFSLALTTLFAASLIFDWASWWSLLFGFVGLTAIGGWLWTVKGQIRYYEEDPTRPLNRWNPLNWKTLWVNSHRAYWDKDNYDEWFSPAVGFGRHALSIDEERKDFPRVKWGMPSTAAEKEGQIPEWLKQMWFAGCHSDVGGSYDEDESRLSDIAMNWMVEELKLCIPDVHIRQDQLNLQPDPLGVQHREKYIFKWWVFKLRWAIEPREVESLFPLHPSVLTRLEAKQVPHDETVEAYRPDQLKDHYQAKEFFGSKRSTSSL
ncbi:MAG: DUF2235 domain-containing protein [Pseudomonadota bacterium]